jgi:hypothetical protein
MSGHHPTWVNEARTEWHRQATGTSRGKRATDQPRRATTSSMSAEMIPEAPVAEYGAGAREIMVHIAGSEFHQCKPVSVIYPTRASVRPSA